MFDVLGGTVLVSFSQHRWHFTRKMRGKIELREKTTGSFISLTYPIPQFPHFRNSEDRTKGNVRDKTGKKRKG